MFNKAPVIKGKKVAKKQKLKKKTIFENEEDDYDFEEPT